MANLRIKLPPEARARLDAVTQELDRLFGLEDRWLGEEILRLARDARALLDTHFPTEHVGYDQFLVSDLAPEIARRLGAKPNADESQNVAIRASSDREIRERLGRYFNNMRIAEKGYELRHMMESAGKEVPTYYALDILGHEFVNGNPLAMAVDRICTPAPADSDRDDWIARHTREISRNRGHAETAVWTPALNARVPRHDDEEDCVIDLDF